MAKLRIDHTVYEPIEIARAAGLDVANAMSLNMVFRPDGEGTTGELEIPGLTQEQADAALAAYDSAGIAARKAEEQRLRDLAATDAKMARVSEDLLNALLAKGVLAKADLPVAAVDHVNLRRSLRGQPAL